MTQFDKDDTGGLALVPHLSTLPACSESGGACSQVQRDLHTLTPDQLFFRILFGLLPELHLKYLNTAYHTTASDTLYAIGSTLAWAVASGSSAVGARARTVSASLAQQMEPRVRSLSSTIYEEARKRSASVDIDQVKNTVSTTVSTLASSALPYVQSGSQALSSQTSAAAEYVSSLYQSYMAPSNGDDDDDDGNDDDGGSGSGGGSGEDENKDASNSISEGNPYVHTTSPAVTSVLERDGRVAVSAAGGTSTTTTATATGSQVDIPRPPATAPHVYKGSDAIDVAPDCIAQDLGGERATLYPNLFDPDAVPSAPPLPPDLHVGVASSTGPADSTGPVAVQYPVL